MSENILKVSILGPTDIGKTCLFHYIAYGEYLASQINPTTVANFLTKNVEINCDIVTLQLWDTAGQERFATLNRQYIRNSDVIIIAFNPDDVDSISSNFQLYHEVCPEASLILVATKNDTYSEEKTKQFEKNIPNLQKQFSPIEIFSTSSLRGTNIEDLTMTLAHQTKKNHNINSSIDVNDPTTKQQPKEGCC